MRYFFGKGQPATALNLAPIGDSGDQQNAKEQSRKLKYAWTAYGMYTNTHKKRYVL